MNIREDIMTPKERLNAFLTGKPMDRLLCMPIVTGNTAHLIGKTMKEFQLDAEIMAKSHIAGYERFKYDLVYLFTNCSYVAEAMGAELVYLEDEPANCENPIINSNEDLSKIRVAEKNDGKFPVFYDALDILNREIGDKIFLSVCFSGPVSTAATLRGVEAFAKDTYANPELCHTLLRMATDSCKNLIKGIIEKGAIPIILEPIASGSIFSPKMFQKFSFPYIKELIDFAHELGMPIPLHICGKTHKIVDQMTETGSDIISIDKCDLEIAKEKVAGRAVILGNIDPADELLFGPEERIHEVCRKAIEVMKDYKPGFVLATGCETANKVPFENIQAMMDAVRTYGIYEYNEGI